MGLDFSIFLNILRSFQCILNSQAKIQVQFVNEKRKKKNCVLYEGCETVIQINEIDIQ